MAARGHSMTLAVVRQWLGSKRSLPPGCLPYAAWSCLRTPLDQAIPWRTPLGSFPRRGRMFHALPPELEFAFRPAKGLLANESSREERGSLEELLSKRNALPSSTAVN